MIPESTKTTDAAMHDTGEPMDEQSPNRVAKTSSTFEYQVIYGEYATGEGHVEIAFDDKDELARIEAVLHAIQRSGNADEYQSLATSCEGRARFLRDRGEVKSPDLLERAAKALAFAVDAKVEYPAFASWWARTIPAKPVPNSASHYFYAWISSARHRVDAEKPQE
jgi:hypothetical protein